MKYIISIVFITALLPGIGPNLNLGVFFLSPFRAAIILLPVVWFGKKFILKEELRYYIKKQNMISILFFVLWFVYSLVTVFWAKSIGDWSHGEYFFGIGLLCILFFDMSELRIEDFDFILKGAWSALALHNLLGWYEVWMHKYLFLPMERLAAMRKYNRYYPVTTMLNQNDLILVLIFGVCVFSYFMGKAKTRKFRMLNAALLISDIGLAVATDSRAGLLGMAVGILVLGMFMLSSRQKSGISLIAVISGAGLALVKPEIIIKGLERFKEIDVLSFENAAVNSDAVRLNLIQNGLVFLKETFGFGVGTGNAEYWMQTQPVYYVRGFTNMHNWWIEILTNYGILIFILYTMFYCYLFYSLFRKYRRSQGVQSKRLCILFMGFMGAFLIGSISSSSNWGKEWLWVLWALIIAFQGTSDRGEYIHEKENFKQGCLFGGKHTVNISYDSAAGFCGGTANNGNGSHRAESRI